MTHREENELLFAHEIQHHVLLDQHLSQDASTQAKSDSFDEETGVHLQPAHIRLFPQKWHQLTVELIEGSRQPFWVLRVKRFQPVEVSLEVLSDDEFSPRHLGLLVFFSRLIRCFSDFTNSASVSTRPASMSSRLAVIIELRHVDQRDIRLAVLGDDLVVAGVRLIDQLRETRAGSAQGHGECRV